MAIRKAGKGNDYSNSNDVGESDTAGVDEDDDDDCLTVELAGLASPPPSFYIDTYSSGTDGMTVDALVKEQTLMTLQLLGRKVVRTTTSKANRGHGSYHYPDRNNTTANNNSNNTIERQVVVGRLYYRPSFWQLWATDLADPLVRYGRAMVESELFVHSTGSGSSSGSGSSATNTETPSNDSSSSSTVVVVVEDASTKLKDLQKDVKYLQRLSKLEKDAVQKQYGMWSHPQIREWRRDVVDEIEFQNTAPIWQRLWRWWKER